MQTEKCDCLNSPGAQLRLQMQSHKRPRGQGWTLGSPPADESMSTAAAVMCLPGFPCCGKIL